MTTETIADRDVVADVVQVDGRTRRRRRNIDAVVDAVIELARSGNLDPTSEQIAEVAGISHRSIYRYFDTRAELLEAAVVRAFESVSSAVVGESLGGASFEERAERFVTARIEVHEQFRSVARVAWAHADEGPATVGLAQARSTLRAQCDEQFASELDRFAGDERRLILSIVDAMFQFESLEYLSTHVSLDEPETRETLVRHLRSHLRIDDPPTSD